MKTSCFFIGTTFSDSPAPQHFVALARELVRLRPDVLVTSGPQPSAAAKAATAEIPIVFGSVGVSGVTSQQDAQIAQAGIDALK